MKLKTQVWHGKDTQTSVLSVRVGYKILVFGKSFTTSIPKYNKHS